MDEKLQELKQTFEQSVPTSFTEMDKQRVLHTIQNKKSFPSSSILPKVLTTVTVALFFFFGFFIVSNQQNSNELANQSSPNPNETEDGLVEMVGHFFTPDKEKADQYLLFNPDTVQKGDSFGFMEVTNVSRNENSSLAITFEGKTNLVGTIYDNGYPVFVPDNESAYNIPISTADLEKNIRIRFDHSEKIAEKYGMNVGTLIPERTPPIENEEITVLKIKYYSSEHGTFIDLEIADLNVDEWEYYPSQTYTTKIELSGELLAIYQHYAATQDESLLKDLKPFDVFRLYQHALSIGDVETEYALFIKGEQFGTPDEETYFSDPVFWGHDEEAIENGKKSFEKLKEVHSYREISLPTDETGLERAVISYTLPNEEGKRGFQIIKDPETGVWKVPMMPLQ